MSVDGLLAERTRLRALGGDAGLEASIAADLDRLGYHEAPMLALAPARVETPTGLETTAVHAPEQAIPKHKGGRPPLPRCEHGQIVGRCKKCPKAA